MPPDQAAFSVNNYGSNGRSGSGNYDRDDHNSDHIAAACGNIRGCVQNNLQKPGWQSRQKQTVLN